MSNADCLPLPLRTAIAPARFLPFPPHFVSSSSLPSPTPRLKLRLTPAGERAVRSGHPWIFAESIREQNRDGQSGELAVIYTRESNRYLGTGFYDANSPMRVRMLASTQQTTINTDWWQARLNTAVAARSSLVSPATTGIRLINGESDGFPALVLDRYHNTLVLKLYSEVWLPHLDMIQALIVNSLKPDALVLRLSRNAAPAFAAADITEGLRHGNCSEVVVFLEDNLRLEAEVLKGQKTGFYLDQRENRRRFAGFTTGAHVLNAFSFSGGFSLQAARGGARSVTDIDISRHALTAGDRNFALNQDNPAVANCQRHSIQADAFQWLANPQHSFDAAVIDPPSLARRESDRTNAIAAYHKLAITASRHVRGGGLLLCSSCSAHVSAEEFFNAVRRALPDARELWTSTHAPDHPAAFPEAAYLKAIALRLASVGRFRGR